MRSSISLKFNLLFSALFFCASAFGANSFPNLSTNQFTVTGATATTVPYFSAGKVLTSSSVTPTQLSLLSSATDVNTPSTLVKRDASGNFSAGTITAALTGNSSTATALAADPADCASDRYANAINASGTLACAQVTNAGLAGSIAASKLIGSDIATVGTITTGTWTGTAVDATHGGTNQTSWTTGDLLYASAANTLSKLAAGTSTYVLTANGAGVAPSWQINPSGTAINKSVVSKSANYSITSTDDYILVSASGGANTQTLPTASTVTGKIFVVRKTSASSATLTVTVTDSTYTRVLNLLNEEVTVYSDGTNYQTLSIYVPTVALQATKTGAQTLTTGATTTVVYNVVTENANSNVSFNTGTGVATVLKAGTYIIGASLITAASQAFGVNSLFSLSPYIGGISGGNLAWQIGSGTYQFGAQGAPFVKTLAAGDVVDIRAFVNSAGNIVLDTGGQSHFSIFRLGD